MEVEVEAEVAVEVERGVSRRPGRPAAPAGIPAGEAVTSPAVVGMLLGRPAQPEAGNNPSAAGGCEGASGDIEETTDGFRQGPRH